MQITIKTKKGDRRVEARSAGVPGIVVHKHSASKGWAITHKPSGYLITGESFNTRDEAISIAKRFAGLTDWTASADKLGDMAALGRAVRQAIYGPTPFSTPGEGCCTGSIVEEILPDGWELDGDDLDGLLVCPHGATIEMDGVCPQGCISPLRTAGLI